MKKITLRIIVNSGLLVLATVMTFSGITIQFNYHMGNHNAIDTSSIVFGITYIDWSNIHKISIVLLSVFMIFHFALHWKWYITVIKRNLLSKNKQVIILSILFTMVAITGYVPWIIKISEGNDIIRKFFIEIHDKLALILIIYLILHVRKRLKWFGAALNRFK